MCSFKLSVRLSKSLSFCLQTFCLLLPHTSMHFIFVSGSQSNHHWPPFCLRVIYAAHGERTATTGRVSGWLGVDRAAHLRKRLPSIPSRDAKLSDEASFSLPGLWYWLEGLHVTSYQGNFASHLKRDRHVVFFFVQDGIGKHKNQVFHCPYYTWYVNFILAFVFRI